MNSATKAVHCAFFNIEYHEAEKSSNNTGELTAIGVTLVRVGLQAPSTINTYKICTDSTYALDALTSRILLQVESGSHRLVFGPSSRGSLPGAPPALWESQGAWH